MDSSVEERESPDTAQSADESDDSDKLKEPPHDPLSSHENDQAERQPPQWCLLQLHTLLMQHKSLLDAVDTLRAGCGGNSKSTSKAGLLEALSVVRGFAASEEQVNRMLSTLSGAYLLVEMLYFSRGNFSKAVGDGAGKVWCSLMEKRDAEALDAIAVSADPVDLVALLRGGGAGREMALRIVEVAGERLPHVRNAMLAAGVAPVMIELASEERERNGTETNPWDYNQTEKAFSSLFHWHLTTATPLDARAALPGVLECARRPTMTASALDATTSIIHGCTTEHVQAALDAGVHEVLMDALSSGQGDVEGEAWRLFRQLAFGSAAQRNVLFDAGVVPALCKCAKQASPSWLLPRHAMRSFAYGGGESEDERAANRAFVCERVVPQLLTIAAQGGPAACGAVSWLSFLTDGDKGALRNLGVIPLFADFLMAKRDVYGRAIRYVRRGLYGLCWPDSSITLTQARVALPALARLYTSEDLVLRKTALECALLVWDTSKRWIKLTPPPINCSEEQAQLVLDAGFAPLITAGLKSRRRDLVRSAASLATYVATGSAQQVRCLLDAGVLQESLRYSHDSLDWFYDHNIIAARLVVASAMHGAECGGNSDDRGLTLLETHALPQVLEAMNSGWKRRRGERYSLPFILRRGNCMGALRMLQQLISANAKCREAVFCHPDTLAAVARVASGKDYHWDARKQAAVLLSKLCEGPPPPSVALAHKLVSLLLPLCKSERKGVAELTLKGLRALAKIIPEVVDEALKKHELPGPPVNDTDSDVE